MLECCMGGGVPVPCAQLFVEEGCFAGEAGNEGL